MKGRKKRDYYTISEELYNIFNEHIEFNNLNKSKLIESLIQEYVKNKNKRVIPIVPATDREQLNEGI